MRAHEPAAQHRRVLLTVAVGVVAGAAGAYADTWQFGVLAGWTAAAAALLGATWFDLWSADADTTRRNAVREDDNRVVTDLLVVVACVASLAAVAVGLHTAADADRGRQVVFSAGAVVAIALAWAVVHTVFALRYAHEYYTDVPGGVDFPGDDAPAYADFAYLAFGIGMTFQVSDTAITSPHIRRTVLVHTFVAYLFGTAVIAASINIVAGFA